MIRMPILPPARRGSKPAGSAQPVCASPDRRSLLGQALSTSLAAALATALGLPGRARAAAPAGDLAPAGEGASDVAGGTTRDLPSDAAHPGAAERAAVAGHFQSLDLDFTDAARRRPVPLRLYLPEGPAPVPLLLFSHGLGGSRLGYSYLGQHLARHGVASLHVQHVGSDRSLWSGAALTLLFRLREAAGEDEAMARVHDLRFALDQVLAEPRLAARLDAGRIVAAGHSYGANTAMLAGGARVLRQGRPLPLRDERLRGLLLLSAPPFHGEGDMGPVLGPVQLPSLHVTTTEDEIKVPGYHSDTADRLAVYQAMGSPRKALAVFAGGSHSIFTDRLGPGGPALNARVKAATQDLTLAFLGELFDLPGAPGLADWRQRQGGLLAQFTEQRPALPAARAASAA